MGNNINDDLLEDDIEESEVDKIDGNFDLDDNLDDIDRLLIEKNNARKKKSVLQARRRKRQLHQTALMVSVIGVVVFVSVIVIIAIVGGRGSSMREHDANELQATMPQNVAVEQSGETQPGDGTQEQNIEDESTGESEIPSESILDSQTPTESETPKETAKETESATKQETTADVIETTAGGYIKVTDSKIASKYVALYDMQAGKLVAGKNEDAKMYPASMTKVMTLIVACEQITDWNATSSLTRAEFDELYVRDASMAYINYKIGDKAVAEDLLYGLILPSGCDAAVMLAKIVSGSEEAFANLMNKKCRELGLNGTHFVNASGLHHELQYTTVSDMAKIMEYAMNNATCAKVLNTSRYVTKDGKITWQHNNIKNYNSVVYTGKTAAITQLTQSGFSLCGAKSGYTNASGNCLATCVEKNGKKYIAVVGQCNGSAQAVKDSTKLFVEYIN